VNVKSGLEMEDALTGSRSFDLTQTVDADNRAIQYSYDKLGRETQENWYASVDQSGNPVGSPTETINYGYDYDGGIPGGYSGDTQLNYWRIRWNAVVWNYFSSETALRAHTECEGGSIGETPP
jgi:YD repeat-containing protein